MKSEILLKNRVDKRKELRSLFGVCLMIIIILPLLIGVLYALPAADDFSHANDMNRALQNNNIFTASCIKTAETYMG